MTTTEDRKDLHLRFPQNIWDAIKKYAKESGCSYTNVIYTAVFFFLYTRNLITFEKTPIKFEEKRIINKTQAMPEELKFCDGDSCEVN